MHPTRTLRDSESLGNAVVPTPALGTLSSCCARLSPVEYDQLVDLWNRTEHRWDDAPCLHELFTTQSKHTPDAIAVIHGDLRLTYAELEERSRRVACRLIELGVSPGDRVAVVADGTPNAYIGLLGILRAGAAYLPIDPTFPADRIRFFFEDAAVRFVVGNIDPARFEDHPGLTFVQCDELPTGNIDCLPSVAPTNLAYVLFTSGSTGKPKGVMLNHQGPVNTVRDINLSFDVQATDRVLALSALGFDLSVYDLFGMFAAGAAIVLPTPEQSRDPHSWRRLIEQHQVTIWNTVPALMDMFVTSLDASTTLPSLRRVMLSGDWIPVSLPDRIRHAAPKAHLYSLGGSTEASIWTVLYPIDRVDPDWRSIPYGKPLRNQRCYVVDAERKLCKIGEVGELCLAGVGVALGYVNRPELTQERFIPDPFSPGDTLYLTGDLCRYGEDGNLEFLGRQDHQVKIRGYRIGLGEIDAETQKLPAVRDAVVVASEEEAGARLIAYVVFESGQQLTLEELQTQLAASLPKYMLPAAMVPLDRLPLTANGKIDRKGLPSPTATREASPKQQPSNPTEAAVCEILSELLHRDPIDPRDGFIALGGNSLVAVALASRLKTVFGIQIPYWDILANSPNAIRLASRIETHRQSPQPVASTLVEIGSTPLDEAPLSYQQQQIWVEHFLKSNRARYNIPLVYDLVGEVDLSALQQAFTLLIDRHAILRTLYTPTSSGLTQRPIEPTQFTVESVDLGQIDSATRQQTIDAQTLAFVSEGFDLDHQIPIRAAHFKLSPNQSRMVVSVHHIAFDGHSIDLLHRDLASFYRAIVDRKGPTLAALPYQYANYALAQQTADGSDLLDADRAYWQRQLSGELPQLDLPRDPSDAAESEGDTISLQIDRDLLDAARRYSSNRQSTLFVTLLAAIKATLFRYTGQQDLIVGSAVAARPEAEMEDLIGYFINVLPLRTQFAASESFDALQTKVRETTLSAMAHQNYPLELMKREIFASQGTGTSPFRVLFVLENEPCSLELTGVEARRVPMETQTAKFDLLIAASESDASLRIDLQYRCQNFCRERIVHFGEHLTTLLSAAVEAPATPVDRLQMLPASQRASLLQGPIGSSASTGDPNATEQCDDSDRRLSPSVLTLFDAQVERSPDSTAVCFEEQTFSYAELDRRATILASRLIELGVLPDLPVALSITRSPEMVVAVLAVLKAGGCYVPVDPALPRHRRKQILDDCQPQVLLTLTGLTNDLELNESATPTLRLDTFDFSNHPASTIELPALSADNLAYILYTSGSTGKPKGVAMPHGAVANLIAWQLENSQADPTTKTLQFASLGFDVSFQEIFATLCSGGQLELVSEDRQQDLHRLWKFIVDAKIGRIFVPFVVLRTLCEIAGDSAREASLREVITAGEQLQITPAVRKFFQQQPGCRLWNHYGPTETHVATGYRLAADPSTWPAIPPIGKPIDRCVALVLDEHMQPLPQGIEGELYLGGACVARGYYQNPSLTQQRFVSGPLATPACDRMYRTGDICRLNWDGELEFVRRNDDQIKLRGHRVELSEIETVLNQHADVKQAVVCFDPSSLGGHLIAYVLSDSEEIRVDDLKQFLQSRLPAYMLPNVFCIVDDFPKTASGKIDRKRLPKVSPSVEASERQATEASTPNDPLIARLLEIWRSVLDTDQIDAHSNFFDCGGDSLAAALLFARMESEFGQALSITKLVECPTVTKLAELYRQDDDRVEGCWNEVMRIDPQQSASTAAPLFCLPGIDGHLLNFRDLAAAIGQDRPVYGLQPYGLDGNSSPCTSIEEIASRHVQEIRRVMPNGPYHLAGFSFGGVVAYEISQQLRRAGEQVTLAILDAYTGLPKLAPLYQRFAFHLRFARQCDGCQRWKYLAERVTGLVAAIQHRFGWITMEQRLERIINAKGNYAKVAAMNMTALDEYRPTAAQGPATLYRAKFRADWPGQDATDPNMGWGNVFDTDDLDVIEVEGAHANMLSEAKLAGLVEHLRRTMSRDDV
ncbi:Linear gramicidin synthase subunit D [Rosistilla carotiformis]|uniref:Linear gramicidin synthase subunit D n=1 Tax=Rosistilla carotiformis TaxID=2528017 RepID=A0A518K208_9BACT|nr:non-ribosomal peptide synthetase [Rosistilla carotiformis]QDV71807.1 Linear gramicidin synthase subunit D [Rosistilla carotiformis]